MPMQNGDRILCKYIYIDRAAVPYRETLADYVMRTFWVAKQAESVMAELQSNNRTIHPFQIDLNILAPAIESIF